MVNEPNSQDFTVRGSDLNKVDIQKLKVPSNFVYSHSYLFHVEIAR